MKWTQQPPKKPGYYWWTNFGEHTPTILKVEKDNERLYATNGEYCFEVDEGPTKADPIEPGFYDEEDREELSNILGGQKFYCGETLWSDGPVKVPELNGEKIDGEF